MSDSKIKKLNISRFRGIPNDLAVSFCKNDQPVSTLIFGDNGSGKSSLVDAIEFVTQGTIQTNRAGSKNNWLYNSVSLKSAEDSVVQVTLDDDTSYEASLVLNEKKENVLITGEAIRSFVYAPFILRRRSILTFWDTPNQQKLMVFFKYTGIGAATLSLSDKEKMKELEDTRASAKQRKRDLLDSISGYFKFDAEEFSKKNKTEALGYFKLFNHNKSIMKISEKHPKYKEIHQLMATYDEILDLNKQISTLKNANADPAAKGKKEVLTNIMKAVAPDVTEAFKKISRTNDYVKRIDIDIAEANEVSMEFTVVLENGQTIEPTMLFSEANRDLLALLIYFEFIRHSQEKGQAKVLVLDDIFQSVDSTIRFRVMQYVLDRFAGWQIIITTHDRLWKEQLTTLFRNHSVPLEQLEIVNWSFDAGPQIIGSINNFDEKLIAAKERGSASDICAAAGYLLEYICEKLSCILGTSIKRRMGDRYTIGDLWPGIYKELKKSAGAQTFSELNDLLYLRNMVGSHYNEWSLSLSRSEANDFAEAVLNAYYLLYDKESGRWIRSTADI